MSETVSVIDVNTLTKYKDSAKIVNAAMLHVASLLEPGANVAEICAEGDKFISDATHKIYGKLQRGIAFPTCISPNNIIANFSPLMSDSYKLREGDLVKVELGVHIDGYPVIASQTFIMNSLGESISDRRADVLIATNTAVNCLLRQLSSEMTASDVKKTVDLVAYEFKCFALVDVQLAELGRFHLYAPSSTTLGVNKAWSFNIAMSTNDCENKPTEIKSTIYEKMPEVHYSLKMKASRQVYSEISKMSGFPFNIRALSDGKGPTSSQKIGINECFDHGLLNHFLVLSEEEDEFVSRVRFTVLMLDSGPICLNDTIIDQKNITTSHTIENDELRKILAAPLKLKKPRKKKET
jgi:hypothetical protein